jgi:hypothetical protein
MTQRRRRRRRRIEFKAVLAARTHFPPEVSLQSLEYEVGFCK